ncbi:response regulator transcription factor [Streptosporangium sp. NPDC050855]|uniref:response regulator transcription factor n=1 Tax=Streptosporangium sp. NPDC050855 TaxID=3366194 RepID=UPI003793985D
MTEAGDPFPGTPSRRRAGKGGPRRSGLCVLWLAEDDVSYHGLPLLLMKVPAVAEAAVGRNAAEARALLAERRFDVAVAPLDALPEILAASPAGRRPTMLAVLRQERVRPVPSLADGYLTPGEISVAGLSATFERVLRGDPIGPPTRPDPSGASAVPGLSRPSAVPGPPVPAVPAGGTRGPVNGGERGAPGPGTRPIGRLTERERAVLALLLEGMSNHQIARAMGISIHGVKRHVSNLLVKFGCSNRTEVALAAERLGSGLAR